MGKTNPTYRDQISSIEDEWSSYRRALRTQDRPHFDNLFDQVRNYADAGHMLNHRNSETTLLLSIMLAQERRIAELEEQLETERP